MLRTSSLTFAAPGLAFAALVFALPLAVQAEKPRVPVPPQDAAKYSMHETHDLEKVTIAAEPGDVKETRPDTRVDYYDREMMPIRVIVTNNSDQDLTLDDVRIHFIAGDNTTVPAATDDELQRRLVGLKDAMGKKIPLPLPLPPITVHKNVDKKILADLDDFGFKTTTVKAHSTVAGYLFYDMQGLDHPVLEKATLELRKVRWTTSQQALDTFEIALHPTVEGKDSH
ncbi:hypothetical protein SAMN05421819_3210 [Bryocella elongata]|uniref:DUF4424 domain-containing protein n=1 Tax=Bryocella elongata TaxID=863522 RepID=A0A1H6ALE6_9BACT|nr:hypothetical protein [Bryocella elongata]SEG48907.1 hypothetical protein SAMN05421819_3210 [Bryocella elongata]